jgi:hypothetical protein
LPGAVLLRPTLSEAGDLREARRLRRSTSASVTALPATERRARTPGAGDSPASEKSDERVPTALASSPMSLRRAPGGRGAKRPASSGRRDFGSSRVRAALSQLAFDRLVPDDDEARARRALRIRRIGVKLGAAAVAAVMVLAVFPVRMWVNQRAAEERAREREEVFDRENPLLEEEVSDLRTDERIEQEARELGYVLPGEEPYGILPAPEAPAGDTPPSSTTTTTTRPSG